MANEDIRRKDLYNGLNNVKQSDWIKAAGILGLSAVKSISGGSHTYNIRDPKNPNPQDIQGLISTVQIHLYKQANQKILKRFIAFGIEEDKIWKALGKL